MAAREAAHERVSTFLVSSDRAQASGNEIREALESSNDEAKVEAMEKAIAALLAGEQLPALFITIVRYVLPSENHQVQKLLLLYLETIEKTDANGKLLPEMILICQNLRNSLQHPNEFIRGVTLRFLTRIREEELLEPLVHSVLANLEHRHSYVRKNAVLALDAIWKLPRGELLAPDAPEVVERLLAGEADLSTRRNAFHLLVNHARDRAVAYLLSNADRVAEWGDVLQIAALDLTRRVCGDDPAQRPRFLKVVLALLQARSTAVVYEAAVTLVGLSSAPAAVRGAAATFTSLLASQSDNNVRLIVLDRLEELAARHPEVMREALMGVLRALAAPDLDVRRKALDLALDLVTPRSVEEVVGVLRKEVVRAAAASAGGSGAAGDADGGAEYRALLVAALHACAARFPAVAGAVLDGLADFLGDASAAAALDVAHFLRELAETNPELRPAALDRAIEGFPAVRAPRVAGAVLWILAEYCTSREDIHRVIQLVKECVGRLPLVPGEGEEAADGGGEEGRDAPASPAAASVAGPIARSRPAVLADGSYATQTALPGSPHGGALAGGYAAAPGVPHLRAALLAGDGFLAGILAASLTKLVLRLRTTRALPAPALNALTAELMLLVASALRACEAAAAADGGAGEGPDADALERAADCLRVMAGAADPAVAAREAEVWLASTRAAFAALLADRAAARAAEAARDAAARELQPDDAIECAHLRGAHGARAPGEPREDAVAADVARATGAAAAANAGAGAAPGAARLSKVVQLTGFSDPIYAEAYVTVHQYDIVLDVAVINRTQDTLQNVSLELATMGDLKLVERPASHTLGPGAQRRIRANIKVSSTETGAIFGNLVFEGTGYNDRNVVVLNDIHIDILDYIVPAACTDAAFRAMWAEFEWENKVAVATSLTDEAAYLDHVLAATNMRCLTPASARRGDAGFLAANLYARSVFGEDALVNVALERGADGRLAGFVRIRSKTQGIALSLGDKLILKQKGV
ncbi:COPB1 [Auxenochlorella protothecoides x Auxenochlorella symbiontica]